MADERSDAGQPAPEPGADPGSLLASDAEREATVAQLNDAGREGRLQLEEFSDRVDRALSARTRGELEALVQDIPRSSSTPAPPARSTANQGSTQWNVSPLGGLRRRGHWRVAGKITSIHLLGGMDLDLREAEFASPEVTLESFSLLGGVELIVPPGVNVEVSGFLLLGGQEIDDDELANPGAPTLHVRCFSLIGGVRVRRTGRRLIDGVRDRRSARRHRRADRF